MRPAGEPENKGPMEDRVLNSAEEFFISGSSGDKSAAWILWGVFVAALLVLFQVNIIHDAFQYYGYLVSVGLRGDLNLYDEIYIHNVHRFYNPFPLHSGRYIGTAVMQAPFFALGHLAALIMNRLGDFHALNGYSQPYLFFTSLASGFAGLAGLCACYFLCREFFSRHTSLTALLGVWLASPLVFFMFTWNGWSHPFDFLFVSLFLLYWKRTDGNRNLWQWGTLGILAGGLCLIRPMAALVLLFPLGEGWRHLRTDAPAADPECRRWWLGMGLLAFVAVIVFSPQFSLWKGISGNWLAFPYREVGDRYNWLSPNILGILFSVPRHGLFAWTPLLLPASLGLFIFRRQNRFFGNLSIGIVVLSLYLYAAWSIWWTGIGFSNRFFISLTPFFILGLAACVQWSRRWVSREFVVGLIALAVLWNIFLIGEYQTGLIPQGIPDPFRVVDQPLTMGSVVMAHLFEFPRQMHSLLQGHGSNVSFFTDRLIHAIRFGNLCAFGVIASLFLFVAACAGGFVYLIFYDALRAWLRRKMERGGAVVIALVSVACLHVLLWKSSANTKPMGRFYRFDEVNVVVQAPAEDVYIYNDNPLPVTSLDLLTYLVYGHAVENGSSVAEVTVYDQDNRAFTQLLKAGVDTAEISFLRPEYRSTIQHGIEHLDVVRCLASRRYSRHIYDDLIFRATLDLPYPMAIRKIRFRYLEKSGRLVVSDMFARNF